ncbi:hypothetical protein BDV25DRAFT_131171 [Aspergillus avenaceus]|uniref:F-box domain-containing protein n=1 Tax=Aspergillus avenaceus TaxID=36643 RepID=A0A5N6TQ50_ASPAV|nr:hypothetical protein BDV25DRAFT_131171 [Aspergillus avenaceus]
MDILWLIFQLLPLLSQACLALSCKTLYYLFSFVLTDEKLCWQKAWACKTMEVPRDQLHIPWNWLLLKCLKLHPPSAFSSFQRLMPSHSRRCNLVPGKVIDLCHCLTVTWLDRLHLEEWLLDGRDEKVPQSLRNLFQLRDIGEQQYLEHRCSITDHARAFINLVMRVTFSASGRMMIQTKYHIHMGTVAETIHLRYPERSHLDDHGALNMEPVYLCPHFNILNFSCYPVTWTANICHECKAYALNAWRLRHKLSQNRDHMVIYLSSQSELDP